MNNLDSLVESAVVRGQLAAGVSPALVAARSKLGLRGVAALAGKNGKAHKRAKSPKWSAKEDQFIKSCLGILSEADIADALGRTVTAVHLRWKRDLSLTAPSKRKDVLTGEQIANGLGADGKSIHKLIDREILPGYRLPVKRPIRIVRRITLLRFITNPMNWVYFNPARVGNHPQRRASQSYDEEFWTYARRLVKKRQSLWKDEWWSIGKVARYRGVDHRAVNKAIHEGRVQAKDWGNWWILKSHATDPSLRLQRWTGKGGKWQDRLNISSRAEGFIVLAAAVGLMQSEIAAMMGWETKRIHWILRRLRLQGDIKRIIKENNLPVYCNEKTGEVFADWKMNRKRFPRLARLMKSIDTKPPQTFAAKRHVTRIKKKASQYKSKRCFALDTKTIISPYHRRCL